MPCALKPEIIALNQIDHSNTTFALVPEPVDACPPAIADSIKTTGILHPPLLRRRGDRLYQIINGRKRLSAAKHHLGKSQCLCLVTGPNTPDLDCLELAMEEQLQTGRLTAIEQAIFLDKVLHHCSLTDAVQRYLPRWGVTPGIHMGRRLLSLLKLEQPLQKALVNGSLATKTAFSLAPLSMRDRLALFEIITELRLSNSNQKKLIDFCRELAGRRQCGIMQVLDTDEVRTCLHHESANRPQQTALLMTALEQMVNPRLTAARQEFDAFRRSLGLPQGVSLTASPSFELDTVTLHMDFAHRQHLAQCWPKLAQAAGLDTGPANQPAQPLSRKSQ